MKIGDFEVITVGHPDGVKTETYGDLGVIMQIENRDGVDDYYVHTREPGEFVYGKDQLRLATESEIKKAFYAILGYSPVYSWGGGILAMVESRNPDEVARKTKKMFPNGNVYIVGKEVVVDVEMEIRF